MAQSTLFLVISIATIVVSAEPTLKFPPGFKFGAATSAYQIEGAWNVSDKGESIWDRFTHTLPDRVYNGHTGDIACDSYNQWKKDVQIAAELGLHHYRFSISWTRLLPSGTPNHICEDGIKYYNDLIDGLLEKGIEPMVTIYHWDLPQRLQDLGGWCNPLITDWFADFARIVFSIYADRVKWWITINEPLIICDFPFNTGQMAPGIIDPQIGSYLCTKHTLLAHAKAWRIYDEEFRPKFHGKVSIANQLLAYEETSPGDREPVELISQLSTGIYSHAIYSKEGGWPPIIEKLFAEKSKTKGYPRSRLPEFTKEEIELVRGTYDYYALNYYTARVVRFARPGEEAGPWPVFGSPELNIVANVLPEWKTTVADIFFIYPPGLRHLLSWLKKNYGDIQMFITENGYPSNGDEKLDDVERVQFTHDHLEQVLLSINEDDVDVIGYTAWSLIDNFEWPEGYRVKFGLYEVNFEDPERTRTKRKSAEYYQRVIEQHALIPIKQPYDEL
ncbi:myrosinase 1-like [Achroia grisella]|uniref:myrosinase 1-like n=1 Tax=Achroia grisella TaxID=688607 RepID=UPI0027D28B4D|nr:myrosinase 1-like [Achroia grisella]